MLVGPGEGSLSHEMGEQGRDSHPQSSVEGDEEHGPEQPGAEALRQLKRDLRAEPALAERPESLLSLLEEDERVRRQSCGRRKGKETGNWENGRKGHAGTQHENRESKKKGWMETKRRKKRQQ